MGACFHAAAPSSIVVTALSMAAIALAVVETIGRAVVDRSSASIEVAVGLAFETYA